MFELYDLEAHKCNKGFPHLRCKQNKIKAIRSQKLVQHITGTQELTEPIGGHRVLKANDPDKRTTDVKFEEDDFKFLEYFILLILIYFVEQLPIYRFILRMIINQTNIQGGNGGQKSEALLEVILL